MKERRFFATTLTLGLVGLVVSVGAQLTSTSGSRATVQVVLAAVIGGALLGAAGIIFFGYTDKRYERLKNRRLRQASTATSKISPNVRDQLHDLLQAAAEEVTTQQEVKQSQVRAALLLPEGGSLRMIPGLTWHIDDPSELEIRIGPGQGSAGRAFQTGQSNVAIYHDAHADSSLPEQQRVRVDANVKWIISTPILGSNGAAVAVLNVDGLVERTEKDLVRSAGSLAYWAQLAGLILGVSPNEV